MLRACRSSNTSLEICRYDEARQAFEAAGQPEQASAILHQLVSCCLSLNNFQDASYYRYQLANEALAVCSCIDCSAVQRRSVLDAAFEHSVCMFCFQHAV